MELQFPWMRQELVGHLQKLAALQSTTESDAGLDFAVHFLFDDTPLPADAVGYYLMDDAERGLVEAVRQALDQLLQRHGTQLTSAHYAATPEWSVVRAATVAALATLTARETT